MPSWIAPACFDAYPQGGRELALAHLAALRTVPSALLPVFLVELKNYDWMFPVEQQEAKQRLGFLDTNPAVLAAFHAIAVPDALNTPSQAANPKQYLAAMTAWLWSALKMDDYREASAAFMRDYQTWRKPDLPSVAPASPDRFVAILIGRGATLKDDSLFQNLRPHGQVRTAVRTEGAADALLAVLRRRAARDAVPYAHWYVDGGDPLTGSEAPGVVRITYPGVAPINRRILEVFQSCIQLGTGPETLQKELAEGTPEAFSASAFSADPRLQRFAISVLTEGSGTQLFSTTFVQWTNREILRRARPATLFARFAPRRRQKPFNAMVREITTSPADVDPQGSLVDGDMAAYYAWLEMGNLPDPARASLLVWHEDHSLLFVAGPRIPNATWTDSPTTMADTLSELLREG